MKNASTLFIFLLLILGLTAADAAPQNDNFAYAFVLSGVNGTVSATNIHATAEPGEPNHGGGNTSSAYSSIWFSWTAPSKGQISFNTAGSSFDTTLAAYTGTAVDNLSKLAENDDTGSSYQSLIDFSVIAGTVYYIAVDGYDDSEQGNVVLMFYLTSERFPWPLILPAILGGSNQK